MSEAKVVIRAKDETAKAFKSVNDKLGKMGSMLTGTTAKIAGLVGAGGFGALVVMSAKAKIATKAFTDSMNASNQQLQAWNYAMEGSGIGAEKLADVWRDSSEKIGEAFSNGGGEAAEVLERLNLKASDLVAMSPDKKLLAIGEAMKEIKSQDERIFLMESLASDSSQLLPYITENTEQFKALTEEAKRSGAAISDIESEKLQAASVSMSRSLQIMQGAGARIASAIAPYAEAFANLFAKTAAEHNGFKDQILGGVEAIVKAVAFMGDMWRGLEAVWNGIEVAFWGTVTGLLSGMGTLGRAIEKVLNMLPGVELNGSQYFDGLADSARQSMDSSIASLDELISKPMPSENVEKFFAEINAMAEKTAAKAVAARDASAASVIPVNIGGNAEDDDKLAQQYEKLTTSLIAEEDALRLSYENKEFIVEEAFQLGLTNDATRKAQLQQLEAEHMQKLYDIQAKGKSAEHQLWEKSWQGKAEVMSGVLGSMSQLMISKNKQMFEIGKKAAIAQAVIDTISSAQKSYNSLASIPYVGPALGAAAAAAALAAGYARVDAIRSTSFDGGGGRSGGAGGSVSVGGGQPPEAVPNTAGNAPAAGAGTGGTTTINLVGDENTQFSYDQVRSMLGGIRDAIANGDEVIIPAGSRQAQELTA